MCAWQGSQLDQLAALCADRFSSRVSFTKAEIWSSWPCSHLGTSYCHKGDERVWVDGEEEARGLSKIGWSQLWNLNVIDSLLVTIFSRALYLFWASFRSYYEWQECAHDFWEHCVKTWCTEHVVSSCMKNEQSLSCLSFQSYLCLLDLHPSCLCDKNWMASFILVWFICTIN